MLHNHHQLECWCPGIAWLLAFAEFGLNRKALEVVELPCLSSSSLSPYGATDCHHLYHQLHPPPSPHHRQPHDEHHTDWF